MTKPNVVGKAVQCVVCGLTKKPRGRSAPLGTNLCGPDCDGYYAEPYAGMLWPGETQKDFGYCIDCGHPLAPIDGLDCGACGT